MSVSRYIIRFNNQWRAETMIKLTSRYIKLLLLILIDLVARIRKICEFIWTGKHEVERICDSNLDIYEKSKNVDHWLDRTKCKEIRLFIRRNFHRTTQKKTSLVKRAIEEVLDSYKDQRWDSNSYCQLNGRRISNVFADFEDGDTMISARLRDLSKELFRIILVNKQLTDSQIKKIACLHDILYRILSYRFTVLLAEELAAIKYNPKLQAHTYRLISLWNHLVLSDMREESSMHDRAGTTYSSSSAFPLDLRYMLSSRSDIVSNRWSHIGFQGEDPGTDFRGMGLLGLLQLEYLSRKPNKLPSDLLKRSLNEEYGYPFAIVGINITFTLLSLFRQGFMKHLYYDEGDILFRNKERVLCIFKTLNDLYVELFLRFDCFWHQSKPKNIFEFKALMEKFVDIVKMDLSSRNFSMKFIY